LSPKINGESTSVCQIEVQGILARGTDARPCVCVVCAHVKEKGKSRECSKGYRPVKGLCPEGDFRPIKKDIDAFEAVLLRLLTSPRHRDYLR